MASASASADGNPASGARKHAVLLTGYAGSGKDAMAAGLVGYRRFALADTLKQMAEHLAVDMWNISLEEAFHDRVLKERPIPFETKGTHGACATPRQYLQWLGTDVVRRYLGDDVWVHALLHRMEGEGFPDRVVITDVRFDNEAELLPRKLEEQGYRVVKVRVVDPERAETPVAALHASEAAVPTLAVDAEFMNPRRAGDKAASLEEARARFRALYGRTE